MLIFINIRIHRKIIHKRFIFIFITQTITKYRCNPEIGTDEDLLWLRRELNMRGMKLMLDFALNHSAADHEKVEANPNMYSKEYDIFHDKTR